MISQFRSITKNANFNSTQRYYFALKVFWLINWASIYIYHIFVIITWETWNLEK